MTCITVDKFPVHFNSDDIRTIIILIKIVRVWKFAIRFRYPL
jgi:hypothetical protein